MKNDCIFILISNIMRGYCMYRETFCQLHCSMYCTKNNARRLIQVKMGFILFLMSLYWFKLLHIDSHKCKKYTQDVFIFILFIENNVWFGFRSGTGVDYIIIYYVCKAENTLYGRRRWSTDSTDMVINVMTLVFYKHEGILGQFYYNGDVKTLWGMLCFANTQFPTTVEL